MWKELKSAEQTMSQSISAIAFFFSSASAVAINMPALQSVFSLTHAVLPCYLSGGKSRSGPRRVVKQCKVGTEDWVLVCGAPQWPHYGRRCQTDGKRLMVHTAHFHRQWWHPDTTWFRDAELQYNTGHHSSISLCSLFKLTVSLDFRQHFCNLSLCISV